MATVETLYDDDLRHVLKAADPASDVEALSDRRQAEMISWASSGDAALHPMPARDDVTALPGPVGVGGEPAVVALPPRRRRGRRIAIAAAAVAAVLTMIGGAALAPITRATPAAAAVFDRAAHAATDPAARADQYWKIVTTGEYLAETDDWMGVVRSTRTEYIAVDGSRPTFFVHTTNGVVRVLRGTGGLPPELGSSLPPAWTYQIAPNQMGSSWQSPTPAWLAQLPRDVVALRATIYRDAFGHGPGWDQEALVLIADVLRSGIVPSDLRRALFEAAKTIPGVGVITDALTLNGRTGVGVGRTEERSGIRQEYVVDPATGQMIGERMHTTVAGSGDVVTATSVERQLVDEVPADVRGTAKRMNCQVLGGGGLSCKG